MQRLNYLSSLLALTGASVVTTASAEPMAAVTCKDLIIHLQGLTDDTGISFTIPPEELIKQCVSSTDAPLTLADLSAGASLDLPPNTIHSLTFTVKDPLGHAAQANVLVTRN